MLLSRFTPSPMASAAFSGISQFPIEPLCLWLPSHPPLPTARNLWDYPCNTWVAEAGRIFARLHFFLPWLLSASTVWVAAVALGSSGPVFEAQEQGSLWKWVSLLTDKQGWFFPGKCLQPFICRKSMLCVFRGEHFVYLCRVLLFSLEVSISHVRTRSPLWGSVPV